MSESSQLLPASTRGVESPAAPSSPAVRFAGVARSFGSVLALGGIDLAIPVGQTVALLGPNGAGKSTAIGLMLGLLDPTAGEVRTLSGPPREAVASGRVGAMLQESGLPTGASVADLVDLARRLYPRPTSAASILERSGLAAFARRRVETLSGGEAQRVRFAMAIAGDPDLLFLDEPTVAMDVGGRRAFWADMRRYASGGRTILFATHYLEEADQVADRIVVLDRGRVVADASPAALKAGVRERVLRFSTHALDLPRLHGLPGVVAAEVRGDQVTLTSVDADETIRALAANVPFRHLEVTGAGIDAAFLALTGAPGLPARA